MKAIVKIPYYDTELHRKGDIVEIESMNRFVEKLPEEEKVISEKKEEKPKKTKK